MNSRTSWILIERAAAGGGAEREEFARRYLPVVRAYLLARWGGTPLRDRAEDAVQDVFVECFREGGALQRVDRERAGFRPYLFGVVRNVARRVETAWARSAARKVDSQVDLQSIARREPSLTKVFAQAWAKSLLRQAAAVQQRRAAGDEQARRRVELLQLRFADGLPIRDIARRWDMDAAAVHKDYAKARQEFREALLEVVAQHSPGTPAEIEAECAALLESLA